MLRGKPLFDDIDNDDALSAEDIRDIDQILIDRLSQNNPDEPLVIYITVDHIANHTRQSCFHMEAQKFLQRIQQLIPSYQFSVDDTQHCIVLPQETEKNNALLAKLLETQKTPTPTTVNRNNGVGEVSVVDDSGTIVPTSQTTQEALSSAKKDNSDQKEIAPESTIISKDSDPFNVSEFDSNKLSAEERKLLHGAKNITTLMSTLELTVTNSCTDNLENLVTIFSQIDFLLKIFAWITSTLSLSTQQTALISDYRDTVSKLKAQVTSSLKKYFDQERQTVATSRQQYQNQPDQNKDEIPRKFHWFGSLMRLNLRVSKEIDQTLGLLDRTTDARYIDELEIFLEDLAKEYQTLNSQVENIINLYCGKCRAEIWNIPQQPLTKQAAKKRYNDTASKLTALEGILLNDLPFAKDIILKLVSKKKEDWAAFMASSEKTIKVEKGTQEDEQQEEEAKAITYNTLIYFSLTEHDLVCSYLQKKDNGSASEADETNLIEKLPVSKISETLTALQNKPFNKEKLQEVIDLYKQYYDDEATFYMETQYYLRIALTCLLFFVLTPFSLIITIPWVKDLKKEIAFVKNELPKFTLLDTENASSQQVNSGSALTNDQDPSVSSGKSFLTETIMQVTYDNPLTQYPSRQTSTTETGEVYCQQPLLS